MAQTPRVPAFPAFRAGTRGSALATTQTSTVAQALTERSGLAHELVVIRTEGDITTASLAQLGGTGVFASALRAAVLDGRADVAVHSLKDLPSVEPEALEIAAVPERADVRDALCAREGMSLADLPAGARIGTGSPRRVAQLLAVRPDLQTVDIRGNVQTRLARVPGLEQHDDGAPAAAGSPRGDLDAVVLACAGLDRVGMDWAITERLAPTVMLPAPGQGALAVEIAADRRGEVWDRGLMDALAGYDHAATRLQVTAERSLMARLEAGCAAPLGAMARVERGPAEDPEVTAAPTRLVLDAVVVSPDGTRVLRQHAVTELSRPAELTALAGEPAGPVGPAGVGARHEDVILDAETLDAARLLGVQVAERLLADGADRIIGA